jgi:prepilin-type N-terminal cleavage/methylation domain-containing protein
MKRMPAKRQSGFTLLELMITLSVAAILSTLAYPSMRDFMRRNRAVEESNSMQSNLQYARGQAAATRSYVSICPMVAGGAQTCDVGATYNNGWLIYTATAPNTAYDASVAGSLQLVVPAPPNTQIIADTAGVLTYNALGELLTPGEVQPGTNVTFDTCAEDTSGNPINTTAVPGIQLAASNNGRIASSQLAAGATCTP